MEILTHITNFLLSQSWQIAVLAGVIAVVSVAARNRSAHVRYLLWLIVLAKCFVPPLHTVTLAILPQAEQAESVAVSVPPMEVVAYQPVHTVVTESLVLPSAPVPEPKAPTIFDKLAEITTRQWLGTGWAVGAAVFVIVALAKAWRTNRWLKKRRRQMPAKMQRAIDEFFAEAGIKTIPRVWLVKGVGQPFVWGLVRGSIYLPHSFQAGNTARCRRAVLGHELSHVLRFDAAVNLLQVIAQGIFWFHPLVWWANKRIRAEREKCCDETAIARLNALPKDYSRAIVNTLIAEHKSTRPVPSLAIAGPVKNIEDRIKTIMKSGKKFYRRPTFITIATVLLLAAIAVPTTLALTRKAERMPDDIESALIEGFCENRDKFKCGALAWTIKTIDEGLIEPSRPRMETEGRYQMWWDGKKIATKYVRDQVVKDPGGRHRIEKERGGNSYNGSSLSRKPRFDYEENWLEYVIRWSGPVTIDKEIPALKKRENIALDFSTVVVDGRKLMRLETRNMDETAVDYRAYSLRYFDPSKGYCLVNRELYTTDDRLRTRCKFKLREVIPGGWFPVEVDLKGLSIKDGTVYLQRHLALDIGRCSFNDRTAIPGDIFKAGIRKLLKEQDKLIEMLAGFSDVKEIDESDSVRRGAREGAEMFLAAVRAADFEKAGELTHGKAVPVDEVKGWRREAKDQDLGIAAVFADDWSAMVICSVFQGDRGEVGPLTFYLGRVALDGHDEWQVHDTDVGTVDETERDLRQFLKKYPQAKQVPELRWGEAVEPVSVPLLADFESLTVEISGMWFWWQHPKFKINSDGSVDFSVGKGPKDAARYSTAFKLKRAHLQQLNKLLSETGWLTKAGANVEPGYTDASRIDITLMREGKVQKVWCHDRNAEPYGSLVNFLKRIYRQEYLLKRMTDADKQERLDALREIEQELRDAEDEPVAAYPYPVLDYDRLVPGCVEVVTHTKDNFSDAIVAALKLLGLRRVESVRKTITELTTAEQVSSKPGYSRAKTEYVRTAAVEALTALGGEQARQHLRYMASNHGSWDRSVNEPIVEGLLKLDGTNSADLLKDMVRSTERAAWGLIRLGEAGMPAIVEILQKKYDPDDGSQVYLIREYIDHWEEIPKPLDKRVTDAVYDNHDLRLRAGSGERQYHEKLLRMAGVPERKRENARGIAETFLAAVVAGNESMIAKLADPMHARWANEVKALRELPELEKLKIAEVYAQRKDNDGIALAVTSGFGAGREEDSRVLIYLGLCGGMAWRVGSINIATAESADRGLNRFLEKYTGAEPVPARAFSDPEANARMAVDVEAGWGEMVEGLQCKAAAPAAVEQGMPLKVVVELASTPAKLGPGVKKLNTVLHEAFLKLSLTNVKTGKTVVVQPYDPTGMMLPWRDRGDKAVWLDPVALQTWRVSFPLVRQRQALEPGLYECRVEFSFPEEPHRWWDKQSDWDSHGFWHGIVVSGPFELQILTETAKTKKFLLPKRLRYSEEDRIVYYTEEDAVEVEVPVRNGFRTGAHIYRDGGFSGGSVPTAESVDGIDNHVDIPKGGKLSYTIEVFETSDPPRHLWIPHAGSGGYKVLWKETLVVTNPRSGEVTWGAVVDGLRFGLECTSGKRVYEVGENVRFAFKIRNVSDEKIELEYVRPNFDKWAPTVRDMAGRLAPVLPPFKIPPSASGAFGFGGGEVVPQTLEPGEEVRLDETAFTIRPIAWEGQIERTVVFAPAGRCKVSHTLVFSPSYGGRGRYLWRGQLTSGEVELEVKEVSEAMPTGSEAAIESVLRLLGDYVSHGLLAGPSGLGADSWRINRQSWEQRCLALRASEIDYLGHVAAEHPEHGYRVAACEALGETQKAEAARLLIRPLGDDAAVVRRTAARALGHLRAQEHIPELLGLLESDPDSGVRVGAAIALGHIGSDRATNGLVAALQSDRNPEVRRFAALSLGWITDPAALPALRQVMKDTTDAELKQSLKNVIRNIEDPNYWGLGIKHGLSRREARTHEQPWGEAVEGVQCRLRADKVKWEVSETPMLKADIRNRGTHQLYVVQHQGLCELWRDGRWYSWAGGIGAKSSPLGPGREYNDIPILLDEHWVSKSNGKPLRLSRRHMVRLAFTTQPSDPKQGEVIRVHSNPVEIEILPAEAGSGSSGRGPGHEAETRRAAMGHRRRISFLGLDLTDAPRTSNCADLPDLFEERPAGSGSYELRDEVVAARHPEFWEEGVVYYVPEKKQFYIIEEPGHPGSGSRTFYGPFMGKPWNRLGMAEPRPVEKQYRFAVYLVIDPIVVAHQFDVGHSEGIAVEQLRLGSVPLLTEEDIVEYGWNEHFLKLTPEAWKRVPTPRSTWGIPFVVVADGHRCYLAAFWSFGSSYMTKVPFIAGYRPGWRENKIQISPPPGEGIKDPRNDPRIRTSLEKLGIIKMEK